jgi:predicted alpha-1,2-mannosidase
MRVSVLAALFCCACSSPILDVKPVSTSAGADGAARFVDPFIGTGNSSVQDAVTGGQGGSTFPGATAPFGMVQWSPDTPAAAPPGYLYDDHQIVGFSLTHLSGAGCAALRDFPIAALVGKWDPAAEPLDSFSHADEHASPGFYEVTLASGIRVDLTATARTGLGRFTFPSGDGKILISGGWFRDVLEVRDFHAQVTGTDLVTGWREDSFFCGTDPKFRVYFAARFDRPFNEHGTWTKDGAQAGASEVAGFGSGVYLGFDTGGNRVVHLKVGISYVSTENALANLDAENPGWDFDAVHAATLATWNKYLNRAAVEGGTEEQTRSFYSALYHAFVQPAVASDVNGDYLGFDGQVRKAVGYQRYANFSGWDIYRSWVQLIAVLAPDELGDMMRSLVESGDECGALPKWSLANTESSVMVGDPADALLASAYGFGVRGFDADHALTLMRKGATDPTAACNGRRERPGLADYLAYHYVSSNNPEGLWGPPSTTLEYNVADFSIAQLAQARGDHATAADFLARAQYWKNLFDSARDAEGFRGYIEPRKAPDVNGAAPFEQVDVALNMGFVEGNAAQYTFFVPHDGAGLVAALGGDAMTVARLDHHLTQVNAGLSQPYLYIGNEPGFGTPWMYAFAGAPSKIAPVVRKILREAFAPTPGGLPGNDDLGATSSWQVWAMLGLYPLIPGVGGLVLTTPTFPKIVLTLAGGKTLTLTADDAANGERYIQGIALNGQASTRAWLSWDELAPGGTLALTLSPQPNPAWGAAVADRPPAFYP